MNYKAVFNMISRILLVEALLMLCPTAVSLIYHESFLCFLIPIIILSVVGVTGILLCQTTDKIYSREGFVIVALSWILMSAAGSLPFMISGYIPSFADAFFETVSGFTTTGASILTDIEALPQGLLFWRSFTHWVGGMGVLVFVMAIMPLSNIRSVHIMRAEVPGPTKSKLVPRMKNTASLLYKIYIVLTLLEVIFLMLGGMNLYDALIHAFGTAGTGGFSSKALSVGAYNSAYIDIVIGVFMLLFGINFNLYYLILIGDVKNALKSEELHWYLGFVAVSTVAIAINILNQYQNFAQSLRYAFFQVSSIITTTGYSTADFDQWPSLSKVILLLLMVIGGCAGSTGGGVKVSRIVIAVKSIVREMRRLLHPRAVQNIQIDGETVDKKDIHATMIFLVAYCFLCLLLFVVVCFDGYDLLTSGTAVLACVSNIGPGLGMVGPMGSFAAFSPVIKIFLSFGMLLGRLEIFPIMMLFVPSTWRRT
jgi:trk system potassium uptake protein TrkH